jgi:hypothetical protein
MQSVQCESLKVIMYMFDCVVAQPYTTSLRHASVTYVLEISMQHTAARAATTYV